MHTHFLIQYQKYVNIVVLGAVSCVLEPMPPYFDIPTQ